MILNRRSRIRKLDVIFIVVMLAVPVVHWLVFWLGVNINSILLAFQIPTGDWSLLSMQTVLREFSNFGSDLSVAVKNTLIYFCKDLLMLPFQLLIAYFLFRKIKGYKAFQIVFYLPAIVSGVAVANMFSNFIAPSGPFGLILKSFGVDPVPEFLANSDYATGNDPVLYRLARLGRTDAALRRRARPHPARSHRVGAAGRHRFVPGDDLYNPAARVADVFDAAHPQYDGTVCGERADTAVYQGRV